MMTIVTIEQAIKAGERGMLGGWMRGEGEGAVVDGGDSVADGGDSVAESVGG